jgi:hypothetical protein
VSAAGRGGEEDEEEEDGTNGARRKRSAVPAARGAAGKGDICIHARHDGRMRPPMAPPPDARHFQPRIFPLPRHFSLAESYVSLGHAPAPSPPPELANNAPGQGLYEISLAAAASALGPLIPRPSPGGGEVERMTR